MARSSGPAASLGGPLTRQHTFVDKTNANQDFDEAAEDHHMKHSEEHKQYTGEVNYLCYGDLIMLTYTKKIFENGASD